VNQGLLDVLFGSPKVGSTVPSTPKLEIYTKTVNKKHGITVLKQMYAINN
jgi:hypothetical protein